MDYIAGEKNNWYFALFNYARCYDGYYKNINTLNKLKHELTKEDVNSICRNELEEVRKAANSGLTYKEVVGGNKVYDKRMI